MTNRRRSTVLDETEMKTLAALSAAAESNEVEEEVVELPPWRTYLRRLFLFFLFIFHGIAFGWSAVLFVEYRHDLSIMDSLQKLPRMGGALLLLWPLAIDAYIVLYFLLLVVTFIFIKTIGCCQRIGRRIRKKTTSTGIHLLHLVNAKWRHYIAAITATGTMLGVFRLILWDVEFCYTESEQFCAGDIVWSILLMFFGLLILFFARIVTLRLCAILTDTMTSTGNRLSAMMEALSEVELALDSELHVARDYFKRRQKRLEEKRQRKALARAEKHADKTFNAADNFSCSIVAPREDESAALPSPSEIVDEAATDASGDGRGGKLKKDKADSKRDGGNPLNTISAFSKRGGRTLRDILQSAKQHSTAGQLAAQDVMRKAVLEKAAGTHTFTFGSYEDVHTYTMYRIDKHMNRTDKNVSLREAASYEAKNLIFAFLRAQDDERVESHRRLNSSVKDQTWDDIPEALQVLFPDHTKPLLSKSAHAEFWAHFDILHNGHLTTEELTETLLYLHRTRTKIIEHLKGRTLIFDILNTICGIFVWCIGFAWSLTAFHVDVIGFFVPFSALLLATSFAYSRSLQDLADSLMLIFITKPFRIGDIVVINGGVPLIVNHVEIIATKFYSINGESVYHRNSELARSRIENHRDSAKVVIELRFIVGAATSAAQLRSFSEQLALYLSRRPAVWVPTFDMSCEMLPTHDSVSAFKGITVNLRCTRKRCTWADRPKWRASRSELILLCHKAIEKFNIEATFFEVPLHMSNDSPANAYDSLRRRQSRRSHGANRASDDESSDQNISASRRRHRRQPQVNTEAATLQPPE